MSRDVQFMFWGLYAAWGILAVYALSLLTREKKIRAEIDRLKSMLEDRNK